MKYILFTLCLTFLFYSCKKSDGNSAPEIKFKKVTSPYVNSSGTTPILTLSVKDADGDFGFTNGADSSFVFIKNISYSPFKLDSFKFPSNLGTANIVNSWVQVEVEINKSGNLGLNPISGSTRQSPKVDTIFFEVYMKDFKKNKSNVIRTTDPMLFIN